MTPSVSNRASVQVKNTGGKETCDAKRAVLRLFTPAARPVPGRLQTRLAYALLFMAVASGLPAQEVSKSVRLEVLQDAPPSHLAAETSAQDSAAASKACQSGLQSGCVSKTLSPGCDTQKKAASAKHFDFFYPLGKPPSTGPLSSRDKLRIAASDVVDPFNLITIGATAAITVGSDSHTDYGPGMAGWAKNSGTLLTEDMTGAFFVTFLAPSLTRQDPRYYRMPKASIPRRIVNAIIQPVWARSDAGHPMPNFGNLIGIPATIALANVYVPGRERGAGPTIESSAIAIASSPIDNFVTEFLPDVAKHVSIHIVLIQRIVNHIALTGGQD